MKMLTDDEFEEWRRKRDLKSMSKWKWHICERKGKRYAIPDATDDLGADIFGVSDPHIWKCRPITAEDTVQAYPDMYINDPSAKESSLVQVRYGNMKQGWMIYIGATDPEVDKAERMEEKPASISDWVIRTMGKLMARKDIIYKARQVGISEMEISNIITAMERKGLVYESGGDIIRV
jgi:hypothetical protein